MKIYKIIDDNENDQYVLMLIEGKTISKMVNTKTQEISNIQSLNIVMLEDGSYRAIEDEKLEFITEIEE